MFANSTPNKSELFLIVTFSPHATTFPIILLHALPEPKRAKKEAFA